MKRITSIQALREQIRAWRLSSARIAFVPTMGNLHQGHLQLVKEAQQHADKVVVSLFVNPTQFGPGEDFAAYPRTEQEDQQKLQDMQTDVLFLPEVSEMYSDTARTEICVNELAEGYCGKIRPGHFSGVATIVCKLFNIVQADIALFGRKDYQQLMVIRRMVEDLNMPLTILGVDTVRETDGLAMSSRNGYLTQTQRAVAPLLYRCLQNAKAMLISGTTNFSAIEQEQLQILQDAGFASDYFSICRADNLQAVTEFNTHLVILAAAKLGKARLIDNIEILFEQ